MYSLFHPPLSAVPIVLLVLVCLGEILSLLRADEFWARFSSTCLLLAAIIVPFTYYSGYFGAEYASQTFSVSESAIEAHQTIGQLVFFGIVALLFLKALTAQASAGARRVLQGVYIGLLFAVLALGFRTAWLGGQLVFHHGAGVSAPPTAMKPN